MLFGRGSFHRTGEICWKICQRFVTLCTQKTFIFFLVVERRKCSKSFGRQATGRNENAGTSSRKKKALR